MIRWGAVATYATSLTVAVLALPRRTDTDHDCIVRKAGCGCAMAGSSRAMTVVGDGTRVGTRLRRFAHPTVCPAGAPFTMLHMVPLPRFAGEEPGGAPLRGERNRVRGDDRYAP